MDTLVNDLICEILSHLPYNYTKRSKSVNKRFYQAIKNNSIYKDKIVNNCYPRVNLANQFTFNECDFKDYEFTNLRFVKGMKIMKDKFTPLYEIFKNRTFNLSKSTFLLDQLINDDETFAQNFEAVHKLLTSRVLLNNLTDEECVKGDLVKFNYTKEIKFGFETSYYRVVTKYYIYDGYELVELIKKEPTGTEEKDKYYLPKQFNNSSYWGKHLTLIDF